MRANPAPSVVSVPQDAVGVNQCRNRNTSRDYAYLQHLADKLGYDMTGNLEVDRNEIYTELAWMAVHKA